MPRYDFDHTNYHELPLDYIMKLCRESLGLTLKIVGNQLHLVNDLGETLSKVTISYAEKALNDVEGRPIKSYLISAGTQDNALVFTRGDGEITTFVVPYATKAEKDVNGKDLTSYLARVQVVGDDLRITLGDGSTYDITVPYAVKASTDVNGRDLTTYATSLEVDGNELVLRDSIGRELSRITVHYAENAKNDNDGDEIKSTYAHELTTGTTTVRLLAKDGSELSEITVPYAIKALTDTDGNALLDDYAELLVVDGDRIGVESHSGRRLSTITVPFATLATDATNAIERVEVVGDQMIFTTFGGQSFAITCPYAIKATNDGLNNEIAETYVANVTNNTATGEITFYDAKGNVIVSMIPQLDKAIHDSYNNLIADYVKQILVDPNSDYVTVVHGTGNSESLIINYASHAWQDSNGNVIKNFYISWLECVEDVEDGHYKLVAYDGDTPRAELFRLDVKAYMAQVDVNERNITSYIGNVEADDTSIKIFNGNDEKVNEISGKAVLTPVGTVDTDITKDMELVTADVTPNVPSSFVYDAATKTLKITSGTALSTTDVQVVKEVSASSTFTGTESEAVVHFENEEV